MFFLFISKTFSCLIEFGLELKIRWERRKKVYYGSEMEKERKRNVFGILQLMSNKKGNKDK